MVAVIISHEVEAALMVYLKISPMGYTQFLLATMGQFGIVPLAVAIFSIFLAYGFWESSFSNNSTSFNGSDTQLVWLALNLFVSYRYTIKPILIIKRGINRFREYCANTPATSETP